MYRVYVINNEHNLSFGHLTLNMNKEKLCKYNADINNENTVDTLFI